VIDGALPRRFFFTGDAIGAELRFGDHANDNWSCR